MFERLAGWLDDDEAFRLIDPNFNGTAWLEEYYKLPTLSIFTKNPNKVDINENPIKFLSRVRKLPAKADS